MPRRNGPGGGATFFLLLESELVQAHDNGLVNETALLETLQSINLGQSLTWVDLARVFGVDAIAKLNLVPGHRGQAIRRRTVTQRLDDIYDKLNTTPENGTVPDVVAATLELVQLLKGVL